jgi:SAM-dependent methyltransferase
VTRAGLRRVLRKVLPGALFEGLRSQPEHWCRVVMNRETRKLVQALGPEQLRVLEISGERWKSFGFQSYRSVGYPSFDLCAQTLDERFDLVIAEQVFEHLLWPLRAARNAYEMLVPGGRFLVTTPFLLRIHRSPVDCSRWTETGLRHLLAEAGFGLDDTETGAWGNRACVRSNFERWTRYRRLLHSLDNEPDYPVVVWALATRPLL